MRAMSVVVLDVDTYDALKLAVAEDEDPVEALATDCADEPLHERIRLRRAGRINRTLASLHVEGKGDQRRRWRRQMNHGR
jgi:hypothetical protein